jgi:hypothetical protein
MIRGFSLLLVLGPAALAQYMASARAGLIHYAEGDVFVEQQRLIPPKQSLKLSLNQYPWIDDGQLLQSGDGRAEMLLGSGAVLWLGSHSRVRLWSGELTDVRLELEAGEAMVEVTATPRGFRASLRLGQTTVGWNGAGVYHISADPARVRVFSGEATIGDVALARGYEMQPGTDTIPLRFDMQYPGEFHYWAAARSFELRFASGRRPRGSPQDDLSDRFGVDFHGAPGFYHRVAPRAGLLNHAEGEVFLMPLAGSRRKTPPLNLEENETLRTQEGRAEVFLGIGIAVRIGREAQLLLVDSQPATPRVRLVGGSALVEVARSAKVRPTVQLGESSTELLQPGIYMFDAKTGSLRIYQGAASTRINDAVTAAKTAQLVNLLTPSPAKKFDTAFPGELYTWSAQRSFQTFRIAGDLMGDWKRTVQDQMRGTVSHKQFGTRQIGGPQRAIRAR